MMANPSYTIYTARRIYTINCGKVVILKYETENVAELIVIVPMA